MKKIIMAIVLYMFFISCSQGGASLSGTGVSGSTARFAIVGDYLYVLNKYDAKSEDNSEESMGSLNRFNLENTLDTFSLINPELPTFTNRKVLDQIEPETLHPVGSNLFVGTDSGMMIISLELPDAPETLSFIDHFRARDPVVVADNFAYVTLRTPEDRDFSGGINELQIYNVEDLSSPVQLSSFPMTSPWGLGVQHKRAYICDGSAGLRVMSVADPLTVSELASVNTDICFDVITTTSYVISTGAAGVNQYKIDAMTDAPLLLSTIALEQPK
jgi:hypothetical protein